MMGLPAACCTGWMTEEAYRSCILQWQNQAPGTSWLWRALFSRDGMLFYWTGVEWRWFIEGAPDNTLSLEELQSLEAAYGPFPSFGPDVWAIRVDCSSCIPLRPLMMPGVDLPRADSLLFSSQLYYRQNAGTTFPYTALERLDWTALRTEMVVERTAPGLGIALTFADQAMFLMGSGLSWLGHVDSRREGGLVVEAVTIIEPLAWRGDWDVALWVMVHELGHAFGLEHKGRDGVMTICPVMGCDAAFARRQLAAGFEQWELDQIRLSPFLCAT